MSDNTCHEISDLLVAYDDGELSASETAAVANHLESCAGCRRELAALSQSLSLARGIWQTTPVARRDFPAGRKRCATWNVAWRAACLLVAACGAAWFFIPYPVPPVAKLPGDVREFSAAEFAELEARLNQEASAARLVASADVLASQPGAEAHATRSLRFVAEVYPHTAAGLEAARRLASLGSADSLTLPN